MSHLRVETHLLSKRSHFSSTPSPPPPGASDYLTTLSTSALLMSICVKTNITLGTQWRHSMLTLSVWKHVTCNFQRIHPSQIYTITLQESDTGRIFYRSIQTCSRIMLLFVDCDHAQKNSKLPYFRLTDKIRYVVFESFPLEVLLQLQLISWQVRQTQRLDTRFKTSNSITIVCSLAVLQESKVQLSLVRERNGAVEKFSRTPELIETILIFLDVSSPWFDLLPRPILCIIAFYTPFLYYQKMPPVRDPWWHTIDKYGLLHELVPIAYSLA